MVKGSLHHHPLHSAGSLAAQAQQTGNVYRIGFSETPRRPLRLISSGLSARGCATSVCRGPKRPDEYRWAEGKYDRFLPSLGAARPEVAVIVTRDTRDPRSQKATTRSSRHERVGDPWVVFVSACEHHRLTRSRGNGREATRTAQGSCPQRLVHRPALECGQPPAGTRREASPSRAQVLRMRVLSLG